MIPIARADLALAAYDDRGVFADGRSAELAALRAMGSRDPSLGRIYEGHFNGVLLVALYGTSAQRLRAISDAKAGELFGVWNTQDDDPVTIVARGDRFELGGAKTWASAADSVTRALITARRPDEAIQMVLVPLDRVHAQVDSSAWRPIGMRDSNSYRIAFDGIALGADDLIGKPGDYERAPWFLGGAIRFAAVHAGIVERIMTETIAYMIARGRDNDPNVRARLGTMRVATQACTAWLDHAERTWRRYDAKPNERRAAAAVDASDLARTAIERAALDVLELAVRTVGAHGLVEPFPLTSLVRDLTMYLRQPAPDAALARVAEYGIVEFKAAQSAAVAASTGSSGNDSNGAEASNRASATPNESLSSKTTRTSVSDVP